MKNSKYIYIALISLTLIGMELAWTRIFSAEFYYTFAFLILSGAILGLGLGALALRLFNILNRDNSFKLVLSLAGFSALIGPILIFQIQPDFSRLYLSFFEAFKFFISLLILNSAFFFGGISLAYILKNNNKDIPKLYMSDLIGAGIGVLLIMLMMNWVGTPMATALITLPILFAALFINKGIYKIIPIALIVFAVTIGFFNSSLLQIPRKDRGKIISTHWDALSKIRVVEYNENTRGIRIDNAAQTSVYKFNGDFNSMKFKFDINVANLIHRFDSCVFLSLGAGGGIDVLHALQENASEIYAVEVNPYINYLLKDGSLSKYSGYIYRNPKVKVITEDARTFVRRYKNKFDIIYALSSNSFAALASGAFALAENYLFTTEAFEDYWKAMTDNGFLIMEHHFYVPRMVSEVIDALKAMKITNPESHFAVYDMPNLHRNILLLSKKPLTKDIINNAFGITLPFRNNYTVRLFPPTQDNTDNLVNQIVVHGWKAVQEYVPFDISPCTDNKPFIAQMGMWKNLSFSGKNKIVALEYSGYPISKLNILVIILILIIIVIPLNLIPYFRKGKKLKTVPWLYFFSIGLAFMIVEVVMIQKYTMFIGPSIYSIITILLALLIASGIGSRFSQKFNDKIPFLAIILWLLLDIFVFRHLIYSLGNMEMFARILITALIIAPLGFFMGMPFPKAGLLVGELIDWGFAVNGAASVLGSAFILLIAFAYGFSISLLVGAIFYLIAFLLLSLKNKW